MGVDAKALAEGGPVDPRGVAGGSALAANSLARRLLNSAPISA